MGSIKTNVPWIVCYLWNGWCIKSCKFLLHRYYWLLSIQCPKLKSVPWSEADKFSGGLTKFRYIFLWLIWSLCQKLSGPTVIQIWTLRTVINFKLGVVSGFTCRDHSQESISGSLRSEFQVSPLIIISLFDSVYIDWQNVKLSLYNNYILCCREIWPIFLN